jgi:hypothetical protein
VLTAPPVAVDRPTRAVPPSLPTQPIARPFGGRPRWQVALAVIALVAVLIGGDTMTRLPAQRPFFGIDVPNADPKAVTALAAKLGVTPSVTSVFLKLDSRSVSQTLAAIPANMTPFVTLEPWSRTSVWDGTAKASGQPDYSLASIIDGKHDAALTTLAQQLKDLGRPVYLRFAHEMNGYWYPWAAVVNGNSAAQYQQAWRHVHDLLAPIAGASLRWVWSPNISSGAAATAPPLAALYPGDAYVDYLGLTGYSHGKSVTDTYCPTLGALTALSDKPVLLSEIGSDGSNKAIWLGQLGPFVKANPEIEGFVYYNTSPQTTGASGNYRIDQQKSDLAALRDSLAELGLPGNGSKSAPRSGKGSGEPQSLRC